MTIVMFLNDLQTFVPVENLWMPEYGERLKRTIL